MSLERLPMRTRPAGMEAEEVVTAVVTVAVPDIAETKIAGSVLGPTRYIA